MQSSKKSRQEILEKIGISTLNEMQELALTAILESPEIVLLSPTGSGKTLAFLLPLIEMLDPGCSEVQVLILAPSRELAIQIEQVAREMGAGFKSNAAYGGRSISKDKTELKTPPSILIGTPGRIADHLRRETFSTESIKFLVLDEFDKSLEIGFEEEMREIMACLPNLERKVLTSATQGLEIPDFVGLKAAAFLDFLEDGIPKLKVKIILSPEKDKLETLVRALCHLGNQPGIIFCNFKDSIQRLSDFLHENGIDHGLFYGGMEQKDRERTLIKFRNGTHQLLLATDLAARGLDIPEIRFIIHYHLPLKGHEFTHRNGRTARMNRKGTAYILKWEGEELPDYLNDPDVLGSQALEIETLNDAPVPVASPWKTIYISGGRKDKISKGDIAGLFLKQGKLQKEELSIIEIKQDCAFVGVLGAKAKSMVALVDNSRLKKKKIRISIV